MWAGKSIILLKQIREARRTAASRNTKRNAND